jgi:hypothetical protein
MLPRPASRRACLARRGRFQARIGHLLELHLFKGNDQVVLVSAVLFLEERGQLGGKLIGRDFVLALVGVEIINVSSQCARVEWFKASHRPYGMPGPRDQNWKNSSGIQSSGSWSSGGGISLQWPLLIS